MKRRLEVEHLDPQTLYPSPENARVHSLRPIRQIARSIEAFGFTLPILIDAENAIIAGHGRVAAAKALGMHEVPIIRLDHLTKAQARAYRITDNRLAEIAKWDHAVLARELQFLSELDL